MNAFLDISGKGLRYAALAASAVGGMTMLVMLGIVATNIAMRFLGGTLRGTSEISGYLCALAVGLCMPAAQAAGSHIAGGVWTSSFPQTVQRIQKCAASLLCMVLLALVARELHSLAEYARDMDEYIDGFNIPYYGMTFGFALGIALHTAIFAHTALRTVFPKKTTVAGGAQ